MGQKGKDKYNLGYYHTSTSNDYEGSATNAKEEAALLANIMRDWTEEEKREFIAGFVSGWNKKHPYRKSRK